MKTIGIDQSFSHTGVTVLQDGKIKTVHSILTYLDMIRFYKENGFDWSSTEAFKNGIVDGDGTLLKPHSKLSKKEQDMLKTPLKHRLNFISMKINKILEAEKPDFVGLEAISFGSKGMTADLGRLVGCIEGVLWRHFDLQYDVYPPTSIKRFAGKGNFTKDQMIQAVPEEDLTVLMSYCPQKNGKFIGLDNIVDSYWIAKFVQERFNGSK